MFPHKTDCVEWRKKSLFLTRHFKVTHLRAVITIPLKIPPVHCLLGGLAAVIYTDTLQTFVMIIGAIILTITGSLNPYTKWTNIMNVLFLRSLWWYTFLPGPQLSTRSVALATWSMCTARLCPARSFPTAPVTCPVRTPCTCSGTLSPETCPGLAWLWVSPYWPPGTGALTRYVCIFIVVMHKRMHVQQIV